VVLFDEIEKAHPDVLNIMLQIFDDGRLTDARGRRVSFSETVIIMTSNLGGAATPPSEGAISLLELGASHLFLAGMQFSREKYQGQIMEAIRSNLRSELVNRISNIVFFYPLSREDVRQIIHKILKLTQKQLEERKITIEVSEDACDLLMDEGFSPTYGAREMERAVQRLIVQPLGKAILSGQIIAGSNVMVNAQNGAIIFQ
jgi:ATP-dependent Clp protease ATP-binding subunit ClpC